MKNSKRFLAIIILAIVAFVSCKKDNENILNAKDNNVQQSFDYRQIEDKITYFKDFRQKMADSKTDEAFNLEDAAWHLACLANLDFCKVNVEYNEVQFDTIEMHVNITGGAMLLSNLNTAYEQMCTEIQQFKKGFNHNGQNLYYINASIDEKGNAKIALMTSLNTGSKHISEHTWYYGDEWEACYAYGDYFSDDSIFKWNTTAARELERVLNLIQHEEVNVDPNGTVSSCFIPTGRLNFDYTNTYDPYHSGFYNDSRVFAKREPVGNTNYTNYCLDALDIVYCLDSYLGLGFDHVNLNSNDHIICWKVKPLMNVQPNLWRYYFHQLQVEYGQLASAGHEHDD